MYSVGDNVVHPMHGAGTIEEIREIDVMGKKRKYYLVHFAVGKMTTNIPVDGAEEIGIRSVIDKAEAKKLIEKFISLEVHDDTNWNKRQRENIFKLKSGDIYRVLEVFKDLLYRDKKRGLSTNERKTLTNARQIILSELVLSGYASQSDIESIISDTIETLV